MLIRRKRISPPDIESDFLAKVDHEKKLEMVPPMMIMLILERFDKSLLFIFNDAYRYIHICLHLYPCRVIFKILLQ